MNVHCLYSLVDRPTCLRNIMNVSLRCGDDVEQSGVLERLFRVRDRVSQVLLGGLTLEPNVFSFIVFEISLIGLFLLSASECNVGDSFMVWTGDSAGRLGEDFCMVFGSPRFACKVER